MTETDQMAFIDHLDRYAERMPDSVALAYRGRDMSWSELRDRARRHAGGQRAAGLKVGDRVGYLGKNHAACIETAYASRYSGTVCAILNWRLAPAEIAYAAKDAEVKLLFVEKGMAEIVEQIRNTLPALEKVVVVDGDYESWLSAQEPLLDTRVPESKDGWIQLYTSGTTGFPKGAVLTYEGLATHASGVSDVLGMSEESISMVAMPLYHVGGIGWYMVGAALGTRSVLIEEVHPVGLLEDIAKYRISHSFFVPAIFGFFMQVPDVASRDLSSLKALCYGASPMPLPLLLKSLEVFSCDFWQVYGMTEQSGVVTMLDPDSHRNPKYRHRLVSAGKAIPSCEIRVVKPGTDTDCAVGEKGEVLVRSKQQLLEYHNKPEATAAAFQGDWYRSGDAGHLDEDGYVYISDRIKDMIISGGENVYPAEIERVLVEHPAVREVAVIGVPSDKWVETPKAVVALEGAATAEELMEHCRAQLAGYKCPTSIDFVEALPRNATGKVLKKDLRAPYWEGRERSLA
ncbi:MAG: long-chain-fatty-acid--CoA ligase [Myxococcota bacterium]